METSTRVYMFALAVADLTICVCAIILKRVALSYLEMQIVLYIAPLSITFSAFLLSFVSVERLLAVRRPFSFSFSSQRAKVSLAVITLAAAVYSAVVAAARAFGYRLLFLLMSAVMSVSSTAVIIICYSLMAVTLLKNARNARRQVSVVTYTPNPTVGLSTVSQCMSTEVKNITMDDRIDNTNIPTLALRVNRQTAKQKKSYKDVSLLFIITLVYLACWVPVWMYSAGLPVKDQLRYMYIVNSVVNPFIYSVVSAMFRNDLRLFYNKIRRKVAALFT
ncbi:hypothetical protein NP493_596g02009 [Ridgeia piscesae]|uniref:G-protein coupled receptors family 1 profile domain-containing protein n=1 Tax=Ridgeia piscesae TaxID=27915 RepID=A0AAD9KUC3_RIDPI|nr:hypothetical protein NP493_596g02009 [Ridgeia piscesae]